MTTPKAKLAGLALIAALCAGGISGLTAPAWAGRHAALMKRVFMFLGLLALASCVTRQGIQERKPDYLANFSGSPEIVAKCIADEWFNEISMHPLVISNRDGMVRMSKMTYSPFAVTFIWELTLRPDGVAEVRGHPTILGYSHGEEVIPLVEKCGK